jgi:transposase-like protein
MNGRYLLDTNIIIALFGDEPRTKEMLGAAGEVFVPSIAIGELCFGARKSERARDNLERVEGDTTMPKKIEKTTHTLSSISKQFSDEEAAWEYLEKIRWPNGTVRPHCGSIGRAYHLTPMSGSRITKTGKKSYRSVWKCAQCHQQFSVLVGTIFEDSRIALSKWLLAIHEMCADKNGISSCELGRKLDITQKSA